MRQMLPGTHWHIALNPAIYLVSILPGIGVWLLGGGFSFPSDEIYAILFCTLAVVLLQHAINLFNDIKDWQLGADIEKHDSWILAHDGKINTALTHGLLSLAGGSILGLVALQVYDRLWVLWFTVPLVMLGLLYNMGKRPLSYTPWGEWVTGLCYGPGVFGGIWLASGQANNSVMVLGMVAFAAFASALLLSHQPPQIETDRAAGKLSFAVRHGRVKTINTAIFLQAATFICMGIALGISGLPTITIIAFFISALLIMFYIFKNKPSPKRLMVSTTAVFMLLTIMTIEPISLAV